MLGVKEELALEVYFSSRAHAQISALSPYLFLTLKKMRRWTILQIISTQPTSGTCYGHRFQVEVSSPVLCDRKVKVSMYTLAVELTVHMKHC